MDAGKRGDQVRRHGKIAAEYAQSRASLFGQRIDELLADGTGLAELSRKARQYVVEKWHIKGAVDRLEQHLHEVATLTRRTGGTAVADFPAQRFWI